MEILSQRGTRHNLTEYGNADRLVRLSNNSLRYCKQNSSWYVWNGKQWIRNEKGEEQAYAKNVLMDINAEASQILDDEKRREITQHALKTENERAIRAMFGIARYEGNIPILLTDFDKDPFLLNVSNGTINLETGELQPHTKDQLLSKISDVKYNERADCPQWENFLNIIFQGDTNLIRYIQQLCGYFLSGSVKEQVLPILFGHGQNGKSTFTSVLNALLGDYVTHASPELLLETRGQHPTAIAALHTMRLALAIESAEGRALNETLVKWLTGGDPLTARHMYCNFFKFLPTHKFLMCTNHKPLVNGTDFGIWRRIKLINFGHQIKEEDKDPDLLQKLLKELDGIMAWAVRGCLDWQEHGLAEPKSVKNMTMRYRSESDIVGQWFEENCVIDPSTTEGSTSLYKKLL